MKLSPWPPPWPCPHGSHGWDRHLPWTGWYDHGLCDGGEGVCGGQPRRWRRRRSSRRVTRAAVVEAAADIEPRHHDPCIVGSSSLSNPFPIELRPTRSPIPPRSLPYPGPNPNRLSWWQATMPRAASSWVAKDISHNYPSATSLALTQSPTPPVAPLH